MKKILVLFTISLLAWSCGDDSDEVTAIEFLQVDTFYGEPNRRFIFATDADGNFLDYQPISRGTTTKLSAAVVPDKVNVTIVYAPASGSPFLYTYTGISKGSHLTDGFDPALAAVKDGVKLGTANLGVKNYTGSLHPNESFYISNGFTTFSLPGTNAGSVNGTLLIATFDVYQGNAPLVFYSRRNGKPVYARRENVGQGQTITLDFETDFKLCETVTTVGSEPLNFGQTRGRFTGVREAYITGEVNFFDSPPYQLSGIAGFDWYETQIQQKIGTTKDAWLYNKYGDPLSTTFSFPNFTCSVTDKTPSNVTATTSAPYSSCFATYLPKNGDPFFNWTVYGETIESIRLKKVSDEVRSHLSNLNFDNIYLNSIIVEPAPGTPYQTFLKELFSGKVPGKTETYWYAAQP